MKNFPTKPVGPWNRRTSTDSKHLANQLLVRCLVLDRIAIRFGRRPTAADAACDGSTHFAGSDTGEVIGSKGSLEYTGAGLDKHSVELTNGRRKSSPELKGQWFKEGFMGSMGALLKAIETKTMPPNNAKDNLRGLAGNWMTRDGVPNTYKTPLVP